MGAHEAVPYEPSNLPAIVVEDLPIETARLPAAYKAAQVALANCVEIDECKSWADKAAALASYARQADDDTLQKQAMRIQARATRRCGELLKEFRSPGARSDMHETHSDEPNDGAVIRSPMSQKEAAEQAGLSERQRVTAVRVANVPVDPSNGVIAPLSAVAGCASCAGA